MNLSLWKRLEQAIVRPCMGYRNEEEQHSSAPLPGTAQQMRLEQREVVMQYLALSSPTSTSGLLDGSMASAFSDPKTPTSVASRSPKSLSGSAGRSPKSLSGSASRSRKSLSGSASRSPKAFGTGENTADDPILTQPTLPTQVVIGCYAAARKASGSVVMP
jgi:hypothetical protein